MGVPMALRLLASGFKVSAYNRTPAKLKPLELAGVTCFHEAAALTQQVDTLILMLTDSAAIRSVLLNPATPTDLQGRTVIQMGTISPDESRALATAFEQAGARYLEAPVLGSIPEAKSGKLIVMVGASEVDFEACLPLFRCLSPNPLYVGEVGQAATLKLAMNQLIGSMTTAFAQSLGLVQRAGIQVDTFMDVVRNSALYAPTFDKKLQRMTSRNFKDPNFPSKHLLKDMGLFVESARAAGLNVEMADSVRHLVQLAIAQGLEDGDYSALFNVVNPPRQPGNE